MDLQSEKQQYCKKKNEILRYYQFCQYEKIIQALAKGRPMYIWSACLKSDWIYELCVCMGIEIQGFIDSFALIKEWKSLPVLKINDMNPKDSFIFVALESKYEDVISVLAEKGFYEFADYLYPLKHRTAFCGISGEMLNYYDFKGNEYIGRSANVTLDVGCKCYIGKNVYIDESAVITLKKNAVLIIEDGSRIGANANITIDDAVLVIRSKCHIGRNFLARISVKSFVNLGAGTSCGMNFILAVSRMAYCDIGSDCMISDDVRIQGSDSHEIYDMAAKLNVWFEKAFRILIEDHVWVGAKSIIRYGTEIGKGSVVGIGSFVNKPFGKNVVIAGYPAKLVKNDIVWKRDYDVFDTDPESFEKFYYEDDNND